MLEVKSTRTLTEAVQAGQICGHEFGLTHRRTRAGFEFSNGCDIATKNVEQHESLQISPIAEITNDGLAIKNLASLCNRHIRDNSNYRDMAYILTFHWDGLLMHTSLMTE